MVMKSDGKLEADQRDFELLRQVQIDRVCDALDEWDGAPVDMKERAWDWFRRTVFHLEQVEGEMVRRGYITEDDKSDCTVQGLRGKKARLLG